MNKSTRSKSVEQITQPLTEKVNSYRPDIAIITETHKSLELGAEYHSLWTFPSKRKPLDGESVACIFSRWPMEPINTFDQAEAVAAKIAHPKMHLIVYGSIVVYFNYRGVDFTSKPNEEQLKSIARHGKDWFALRQKFPNYEMIVGGDYNARLDQGSHNWQRKLQLIEQLEVSGLSPLTDNSFGRLDKRPNGTIDHICVTQGLVKSPRAEDWYDETVSDHSLVVVHIDI
jgi:Endonuclease/Exonuclease/phosphatase family